ncbi:MAG: type IV pilus modification PilV family protein [Acidimicrobiales bacterium]
MGGRSLRRWRAEQERGFTVIEVVIAVSLLIVVLVPAAKLLDSGITTSGETRLQVVAANLATQQLEKTRAAPFSSVQSGRTTSRQTVDGVSFTVYQDVTPVDQATMASTCSSGAVGQQLLEVTAEVQWPSMHGAEPVTASTVLAPPVGAYSPSNGDIAVLVLGAAGQDQASVPVSVSGTQSGTASTTAEGCAFFVNMPPGTYQVSLSAPGWVSDQGQASPSQPVSVTAGEISALQFDYDQATTLDVSYRASPPAASGLPTSIGNTHLQPTGTDSFAAGTTALGPLFPYTDGYQLWAGDCSESDPQAIDPTTHQPLYPGASRDPAVTTTPGQTESATVALPSLAVLVGNLQPGQQATLTATTNGSGCPVHTYGLAAPDPTTGLSTTGVPLGHLHLVAAASPGGQQASADVWVTASGVLSEPSGTPIAGPVPLVLP